MKNAAALLLSLATASSLAACSVYEATPRPNTAKPECAQHSDCDITGNAPFCDSGAGVCVAPPPGSELGWGDGSVGSATLTPVVQWAQALTPTGLAFNPSVPTELWIVNHKDDSVLIVENVGEASMTVERRHDPAAMHFMHRPPALAFGMVDPKWGQTFGVCGDGDNGGDNFMGPALFSADLDIYAKATPGGLGSHLDMLHSTDYCRGIAHATNDAYFVFDSNTRSIDKYDFGVPHVPGAEDHSDGKIYRYVAGSVLGVDGVPSHLAYDAPSANLYIADTGNHRILVLDTSTGTLGKSFPGDEAIAKRAYMDGASLGELVPAGTLDAPSGIALHNGLLYVADHASSTFIAFDASTGEEIRRLDTGLPAGSLAGLAFGPDGKIYFVDMISGWVYRIDSLPVQ